MTRVAKLLFCFALLLSPCSADDPWLVFEGEKGPGTDKHVVLISGDEEYRSEEALPQLAKILSQHHGFRCTVLFAIDPATGEIDPKNVTNIPGLDAVQTADLMIIATRFRNLPDDQMKQIVDYVEAGKPIIGMRTATHAFNVPEDRMYAKYGWKSKTAGYEGGFGRQVLGETWVAHHGHHKHESTRGIVADPAHPIATGISDGDIWGDTDVYAVTLPLTSDGHAVFKGQVLTGMNPNDDPVEGEKNNPMMPIGWTRTYKDGRVFTTTMGAATDLTSEGVRRMLVNAVYWCLAMENQIREDADVSLIGTYEPTKYSFGKFQKGKKPSDYGLSSE